MGLDMPTYSFLIEAMNLAKAQDDLRTKEIVAYAHLNEASRTKIDNKMTLRATTAKMRADNSVTTDNLKVAGISIGNIADVIKDR